jgi:hypothetical protein
LIKTPLNFQVAHARAAQALAPREGAKLAKKKIKLSVFVRQSAKVLWQTGG